MRQIPLSRCVGRKHDGKMAEMHAEMAKFAEPTDGDKLRVRRFTPTGRVYQTITKLTQPPDPKIEAAHWPTMTSS